MQQLNNKKLTLLFTIFIFSIIPLLLYSFVDLPQRTVLKESISLIIYLSFMLLLAQFYIARTNTTAIKIYKMPLVIKVHKFIGYSIIPIFLIHPFLIILPKFFESGLTPLQAFMTIITTINPWGILLGIIAWILMLILGITSMFKNSLTMKHKTWRVMHGILAILFIAFASWHVIDLGRHISLGIAIFIISLSLGGFILLAKTYIYSTTKEGLIHE